MDFKQWFHQSGRREADTITRAQTQPIVLSREVVEALLFHGWRAAVSAELVGRTPPAEGRRVEELGESWINGNLSTVLDELERDATTAAGVIHWMHEADRFNDARKIVHMLQERSHQRAMDRDRRPAGWREAKTDHD
jgi:hypothetical protein